MTVKPHFHAIFTLSALLMSGLLFGWSADARAQTTPEKKPRVTFAVVPLDRDPETRKLAQSIAAVLIQSDYEVSGPAAFEALLSGAQLTTVDQEKMDRFLELSRLIPEGINAYFYGEAATAIEHLLPLVSFALQSPEVLVQRPDLAPSVYESGVILLRAYGDTSQGEKKRSLARLLLSTFPSQSPSTRTSPPEIRNFVDQMRGELFAQGATLQIEPMSEGCRVLLNGLEATPSTSYAVSADRPYFISIDCGQSRPTTWRWQGKSGTTHTLPLSGEPANAFDMIDASAAQRYRAEQYARFVQSISTEDILIGVTGRARAAGSGEGTLLLRQERHKPGVWSDSDQQEVLTRTLPRLLPEFGLNTVSVGDATVHRTSRPMLAPTLLGVSGVLMVGAGSVLTIQGVHNLERAACSEANANMDRVACAGVDGYTYEELGQTSEVQQTALANKVNQATLRRNMGIGVGVVGGAALIGGLLWWRARRETRLEPQVVWTLHRGEAGVAAKFVF